MNRRQLLKYLAGGVAAVAAGEILIPTRTIFLPPRGGWTIRPAALEPIIPADMSVAWLQSQIATALQETLDNYSRPLYYNESGVQQLTVKLTRALREVSFNVDVTR